jgi:hypothetical protein
MEKSTLAVPPRAYKSFSAHDSEQKINSLAIRIECFSKVLTGVATRENAFAFTFNLFSCYTSNKTIIQVQYLSPGTFVRCRRLSNKIDILINRRSGVELI